MAPSYRNSTTTGPLPVASASKDRYAPETAPSVLSQKNNRLPMFDRRRRRMEKQQAEAANSENSDKDIGEMKKGQRRSYRLPKTANLDDEEMDPYDSDPGQSYRQHCMAMNGIGTKTCLGVPTLFKSKRLLQGEGETVLTAPPSPMASEMGDLFGATPASLPPNTHRVRYSLRSSITDGSEKQPTGPSVMDRRELRPNGVHLNVSHWSDMGGRPYMEDR